MKRAINEFDIKNNHLIISLNDCYEISSKFE